MRITARHMDDWSRGKDAQAALPRYVRRLIHTSGSTTQAIIPAGDSTGQPGWDGVVSTEEGNAWIPKGRSYWEMSCEAQVTSKANDDFEKRVRDTAPSTRGESTFVFVTARRWGQKARWADAKRAAAAWVEIRAYDADDLEQWFEQSPAVALQFAEEIGVAGPGVESAERHWTDWAGQTDPTITAEAFLLGRESARDRFAADLRERLAAGSSEPYAIRADSVEEAAAFAAAALSSHPDLSASALIVTDAVGWRFVDQNATLRVAVAARPDVAEKPTAGKGSLS